MNKYQNWMDLYKQALELQNTSFANQAPVKKKTKTKPRKYKFFNDIEKQNYIALYHKYSKEGFCSTCKRPRWGHPTELSCWRWNEPPKLDFFRSNGIVYRVWAHQLPAFIKLFPIDEFIGNKCKCECGTTHTRSAKKAVQIDSAVKLYIHCHSINKLDELEKILGQEKFIEARIGVLKKAAK